MDDRQCAIPVLLDLTMLTRIAVYVCVIVLRCSLAKTICVRDFTKVYLG